MDTHLLHVLIADRRASLLASAAPRPPRRPARRLAVAAFARRSGAVTAGLLALVALGAAGCGDDTEAAAPADPVPTTAAAAPPRSLEVVADDFTFEVASERVAAGLVTVELRNDGAEGHQVSLVRLHDGTTLDGFLEAVHADEAAAYELVDFAGGVNPVEPGGSAAVQVELEAGRYALLCFVPGPGGVTHLDRGMVRGIEVVDDGGAGPAAPADVAGEVVMDDYAVLLPDGGLDAAGTYRFVNEGTEPHEVVLVRLKDGRTLADAAAYQVGTDAEAPFTFEAGPAGMAPGGVAYADLDLEPGTWVALCMLRSPTTGQPHADMGMILPFEVA